MVVPKRYPLLSPQSVALKTGTKWHSVSNIMWLNGTVSLPFSCHGSKFMQLQFAKLSAVVFLGETGDQHQHFGRLCLKVGANMFPNKQDWCYKDSAMKNVDLYALVLVTDCLMSDMWNHLSGSSPHTVFELARLTGIARVEKLDKLFTMEMQLGPTLHAVCRYPDPQSLFCAMLKALWRYPHDASSISNGSP